MKHQFLSTKLLWLLALTLIPGTLWGQATVGKPAPAFSLRDTAGKTHALSDFKGKFVVLEWINHGCPFVVGQYESGKMQKLQKDMADKGVVWLSINSTNPEHRDYHTPEAEGALMKKVGSNAAAVLMDSDGTTGKAYGAKTTPHMFIISPEGVLIYAGAIDNRREKNYVEKALTEAMAGKKVSEAQTQAYGCGVKYK
ncbi:MAG: thioredoxin family protein [Verrucomicrobiae bacterium]|nr:thioredoxin family protein [Verrucomicrobiae bacterium]